MSLTQAQREQYTRELQRQGYRVSQPAQRKSLVESRGTYGQPQRRNEITRMLGESLAPSQWEYLADRSNPLPPNINLKSALHAMSNVLAGVIELRDEQNQNNLW